MMRCLLQADLKARQGRGQQHQRANVQFRKLGEIRVLAR